MYNYVIIGGGIAGIISLSVIYDRYPDARILWIDNNNFTSGDLIKYPLVPANTPYKVLVYFIETIFKLLGFKRTISQVCDLTNDRIFKLECLSKELIIISNFIRKLKRVTLANDYINKVSYKDGNWIISGKYTTYISEKVVLCNGSTHKKLSYNTPQIPIETALNPIKLNLLDIQDKHIVVFGNSHSGILIIKNLYEMGCTNITNVVRGPIRIPYFNEDNVEIYQESGIRGSGLEWVSKNLIPKNKTHIKIIKFNELTTFSADLVIYSIGLKPREIDIIYNGGSFIRNPDFNETGLLARNLYGLGVAYPKFYILNDNIEYEVGMGGFLERALSIF